MIRASSDVTDAMAGGELYSLAEDAVGMAETMLDAEDLDYEKCSRGDYDLCGARFCNECGCLVDKLARARSALVIARGEQ